MLVSFDIKLIRRDLKQKWRGLLSQSDVFWSGLINLFSKTLIRFSIDHALLQIVKA